MSKQATLYRMEFSGHICPFGLKAKDLLQRKGYEVEDHTFDSREETDAFQEKHNVETTPQVFIDGERIGGYDELRKYFGMSEEAHEGTTYVPVIAIFGVSLLMAAAISWARSQNILSADTLFTFIAVSMAVLAIQKLQDLPSFTNQFITYDLLSMKYVPYAYVYPFAEAYAGIGMLAHFPGWMVGPVALFIGTIGAVSVVKAVYIDKRELKCACVGGNSRVPLGAISLTENIFMMIAGIWMLFG
ncbi:MauE/DoxX family redox-associated membrane protein [Pseudidiomarina sp.]|uniref:MauE/DoxX family redox-associated membrane protein n=1 Tax=Pseudidiomarina sp. TaxID=2081707 RepID=UPI00299F236C|nr:MauE/DoxX family redox-associated membrane protein [Pseudidiomarina sp.]MDX1706173.1 glutaredoxin domain-containing protein [Pseudidiomarina sp.]